MCDISTGRKADHYSIEARVIDGSAVVALEGEIDLASASALCDTLTAARAAAVDGHVVIDASAVSFLDCAGLQGLLSGAAGCGGEVVLRSPSRPVRRLFALAGLVPAEPDSSLACDELRLA